MDVRSRVQSSFLLLLLYSHGSLSPPLDEQLGRPRPVLLLLPRTHQPGALADLKMRRRLGVLVSPHQVLGLAGRVCPMPRRVCGRSVGFIAALVIGLTFVAHHVTLGLHNCSPISVSVRLIASS